MGLQFHITNRVRPGGPDVALTSPDPRTVKHIAGDGNCLFRSFSYIITGSDDQHMTVRAAILNHMVSIAHFLLDQRVFGFSSVQEHIQATNMDREAAWGTDVEILTRAHLLQTSVLSYNTQKVTGVDIALMLWTEL